MPCGSRSKVGQAPKRKRRGQKSSGTYSVAWKKHKYLETGRPMTDREKAYFDEISTESASENERHVTWVDQHVRRPRARRIKRI